MNDAVMTVELAAEWFGVSPSTVRSWVADRKIASVGRIGNAKLYPFRTLCDVERETRLSHNLRKARFGRQTAS